MCIWGGISFTINMISTDEHDKCAKQIQPGICDLCTTWTMLYAKSHSINLTNTSSNVSYMHVFSII